jgi:hypothetical protein
MRFKYFLRTMSLQRYVIHISIYVCMVMNTHMCVWVHMYTYICLYIYLRMIMNTYMNMQILKFDNRNKAWDPDILRRWWVSNGRIYIHICKFVCLWILICVYDFTGIHVLVYAYCTHVYANDYEYIYEYI